MLVRALASDLSISTQTGLVSEDFRWVSAAFLCPPESPCPCTVQGVLPAGTNLPLRSSSAALQVQGAAVSAVSLCQVSAVYFSLR